jgi:hypothetical protein
MVFAGTFFAELLLLFLLSRQVTRKLSLFLYQLTRSKNVTIYVIAFLFFPGTVIHELAHFLMAGMLLVPVGHMEFWPKIEGDHVKLGSVSVAQTDIFRRFLIGSAPFLFGTTLLLGMLFFAAQNQLFSNTLYTIILGYVAFEIGNTMFSSRKDMEGALELLGVVAFFVLSFYFLGVRIPSINPEGFFNHPLVSEVFKQGSLYLLIPLGIDILILLLIRLIVRR